MFSLHKAHTSRRDHTYQYSDLGQGRNIRLLRVHRSGFNIRLHRKPYGFTIVERSLDNLPPFEALSYVWGDPGQPYDLHLADGSGSISLTESLHQAIRHLPAHLQTSYIWIDQLCINQQNVTERGHQVSLMGEIFGAAQRVLAWLGPETEQMLPFLEILEYSKDNTPESREKFIQAIDSLNSNPKSDLSIQRLRAMQQLFGPWFMRAWILQESALARDIALFVGRKSFSWAAMLLAASRLMKHPEAYVLLHHWYGRDIWAKRHNLSTNQDRGVHFCRLLSMVGRHFQASDPRDQVIANLGFWKLSSLTTHDIYSDDMTPTKLSLRITRCIVEEVESLDILGFCNRISRPLSHEWEGPLSWVPDWSRFENFPMIGSSGNVSEMGWDSCRQRKHVYHTTSQGFEDLHLRTQGRVVDHVKATSSHIFPLATKHFGEKDGIKLLSNLHGHLKTETSFSSCPIGRILQILWNANSRGQQSKSCPHGIPGLSEVGEFDSKYSDGISTCFNSQWGRKLMLTTAGKIGLVVEACTPGDAVAVLHGSRVPLILRKCEDSERYQLVGDCYVDGIMFGEAVYWSEEDADEIVLE